MLRRVLPALSTAALLLTPSVALASEGGAHGGWFVDIFPMVYWGAVVLVPVLTFGICALTSNKGTVEPMHH